MTLSSKCLAAIFVIVIPHGVDAQSNGAPQGGQSVIILRGDPLPGADCTFNEARVPCDSVFREIYEYGSAFKNRGHRGDAHFAIPYTLGFNWLFPKNTRIAAYRFANRTPSGASGWFDLIVWNSDGIVGAMVGRKGPLPNGYPEIYRDEQWRVAFFERGKGAALWGGLPGIGSDFVPLSECHFTGGGCFSDSKPRSGNSLILHTPRNPESYQPRRADAYRNTLNVALLDDFWMCVKKRESQSTQNLIQKCGGMRRSISTKEKPVWRGSLNLESVHTRLVILPCFGPASP